MSGAACELVARCFAARSGAHLAHLTTTSYAQHMALGDFYDAIASAADEFIECWMGLYKRVEFKDFPELTPFVGDQPTRLRALQSWIAENREECCEGYDDADEAAEEKASHTELANLIDNILAIIDRTIYKLENLR